jgi:hypothetical protein
MSERRRGESYFGSYFYTEIKSFNFALLVKVNKFSMQHYMAESFNYLMRKTSVSIEHKVSRAVDQHQQSNGSGQRKVA